MRRVDLIEHVKRDVRQGVRLLRRSPGFRMAALLTLAVGIGGTTAIFSVIFSARDNREVSITGLGEPERVQALAVTGGFCLC